MAGAALLGLVAGCATTMPVRPPRIQSPPPVGGMGVLPSIRTIVLDPGHGGHDPGTAHFGLREKSLNLDIARRLRTALQNAGFTVVMTRETDQFVPLPNRAALANRLPADLFVSVHVNANRNPRVSGVEVYYPRLSEVSGNASWPPSIRPSEVAIPSTTIQQVLWDLVLTRSRIRARHLASALCHTMRRDLQVSCRWIKPARFVVLRQAWMPAVLVEVGYVTNQPEAERLGSVEYREAAAQALAEGILSYARELERWQSG